MKNILLYIILILITNSCKISGITSDYDILSEEQKKIIVPLTSFEGLEWDKVYVLNAIQLKEEIAKHPKALVYVFKNGCTSTYCKPMAIHELYARNNGYKLFLVMDSYGDLNETLDQKPNGFLYSIDAPYYKNKYRAVYSQYFENELVGKPWKEKEKKFLGNLFFFENGKLVNQARELPQ